jgi:hypothetical protein
VPPVSSIEAEQFSETCESAYRLLADSRLIEGAPSLRAWHEHLRVWHYPAFHTHTSWSVFARRRPSDRETVYLLRVASWDRPDDARRFSDPLYGLSERHRPLPSVSAHDYQLTTAEFEAEFDGLRQVSMTPFAQHPIGIDGEVYGIQTQRLRFDWWCDGPSGWTELVSKIMRLIDYFRSATSEGSPQTPA